MVTADSGGRFCVTGQDALAFNFGKHMGRMLDEVAVENPEYLRWMIHVARPSFGDDVLTIVKAALAKAGKHDGPPEPLAPAGSICGVPVVTAPSVQQRVEAVRSLIGKKRVLVESHPAMLDAGGIGSFADAVRYAADATAEVNKPRRRCATIDCPGRCDVGQTLCPPCIDDAQEAQEARSAAKAHAEAAQPVYERLTPCGLWGCSSRAEALRDVRISGDRTAPAERDDLCPKHFAEWVAQERGPNITDKATDRTTDAVRNHVLRRPIGPQPVEHIDDLVAGDVE